MKKLFIILLATTLLFCLISCGSSAFDDIVSQLDEVSWYSSMIYSRAEITQIEESIGQAGIELTGEVKGIAHYVKASYPQNTWVYVYEFENETDAATFKAQYADNWGSARIIENVVVYGTCIDAIDSLAFN
ncbi:MAG: hypothetical protein IJ039_09025 [Clostridia bacterium]|nr:hypothetical protein [Clostridia bacterium]